MTMIPDGLFDERLFHEDLALLPPESPLPTLAPGAISDDGSAIAGTDHYLFINGGSNRWSDQIRGDLMIDDADLARSQHIIAAAQERCDARGIALAVAIVPEKDVVYPEFSPNCAGVPLGARSVHRLMAQVPSVIYPWADLIGHKHICRVYHRFDSHFNAAGGVIVTNAILRGAGFAPLEWNEVPFTHARWQDDLSVKWQAAPMHRRSMVTAYDEQQVAAGNPLTGTHLAFTAHTPRHGRSAIVFGDSYAWNVDAGISRLLLHRFDCVHFVWSRSVDWDLVDRIGPELVVIETAERFLIAGLVRA